ncbi:MAG: serine/threonine-protein kinase, partial [Planctomycetota bacterium]
MIKQLQESCGDGNVIEFEQLITKTIESYRNGIRPDIEALAAAHPHLAERIKELLPTIIGMEQCRVAQAEQAASFESTAMLGQLGDLKIIREIGRGGMGIVYEAYQESLGRDVAVKVLPSQTLLDETRLKRFHREAQTAARLHHTNIVPVLGVGVQDGHHFYVMQLIDGFGVDRLLLPDRQPATVLKACRSIDETDFSFGTDITTPDQCEASLESNRVFSSLSDDPMTITSMVAQVADALQYAHQQGVHHRDIKPANLILDRSGCLWIADFGLSKSVESEQVTQTGDILGTIRYMAPEQFQGEADPRSDIYSLGLTLYEMLTSRPAHDGQARRRAFMSGQPASPPSRPSRWNASIPVDLETVVLKSIAHDPADRYQTAADLAADLRCVLQDRPISARRAGPVYKLWRWCRRNRAFATTMTVAIAAIVLVAVTATWSYVSEKDLNQRIAIALDDAESSLQMEQKHREKAESTSIIAWEVLDEIFAQFAPRRVDPGETPSEEEGLSVRPVLSTEAAEMLRNLLPYYNRLAKEGDDTGMHRQRIAEAHRRVGDIYQRLEQFGLAEQSYRRSTEIFDSIDSDGHANTESESQIAAAAVANELANLKRRTNSRGEEFQYRKEALARLAKSACENQDNSTELLYEIARTLYLHGRVHRESNGKPVRGDRTRQRLYWPTAEIPLPASLDAKVIKDGISGDNALKLAIGLLEPMSDNPECRFLLAR